MSDQNNQYPRDTRDNETESGRRFKLNITEEQLMSAPSEDLDSYADASRRDAPTPEMDAGARTVRDQRSQQKEASEHRKRNRLKARKNKRIFTFTWLAMILLVSLMIASYLIGGSNDFFAVGRIQSTVEVTIPENATLEQISKLLHESHAIEKPEFFSLYCKLTSDDISEDFPAGTYSIDTALDYEGLINSFSTGPDLGEEIPIMFREGLTAREFAALLEENGLYTMDEILEALNSASFNGHSDIAAIPNADEKYFKLEGYLFPDTYNFFENDTLEAIIERFLTNFENKITDEMRADIQKSGYSLDEIITIASIIQAEAADTEDMYKVSAVLHNRLRDGEEHDIYFLDCDSTLYYPYNSGTKPSEDFTSRYSTYSPNGVNGLPAGAICSPGLDAIMAAIYPSEEYSYAYYFCHAEDGTAYYAATMDEHLVNQAAAGLL